MATTHEVRWAVSATSVAKETGDNNGHLPVETMHENIRRTVGGSGIATTAGTISFGGTFADGVSTTPYISAPTGGVAIGDASSAFIYIKNTGYAFDTATVLGAALVAADTVLIKIGTEIAGCLKPGEGWIIPLHGAVSTSSWTATRGSTTDVAIEVIGLA